MRQDAEAKGSGKVKRTQAELDDLARDPSHNNNINKKSIREREVGLALEEAGEVSTLRRDPTGDAEFIDKNGQKWDVKGFYSEYAPKGYNLESALENLKDSFAKNENVMLDTGKMYPEHVQELLDALTKEGLIDKVKIWPK